MPDRQFGDPARLGRPRMLADGFRGAPGVPPGPAVPRPTRRRSTPAAGGLEVFDVLNDALTRHGGEPRGSYGEGSKRIFRELVDGGVGGRAILAMTVYGDPLKEQHVGQARTTGRPALRAGVDPASVDRLTSVFDQSLPRNVPPNRRIRLAEALVDMALLDMRDGVPPDAAIRRTGLLFVTDRLRDLAADRGPLSPVIPYDPPAPWQAQPQAKATATVSVPALRRTEFDAVPESEAEPTGSIPLVGPGGVNTEEAAATAPPGAVAEPTLLDRLLTRAGKAAAESFKGEIGISEETFRRLQNAGVFRRGHESPFDAITTVRQFNEILLRGGTAAADLALRSSEALISGAFGALAQFAEELGMDRGDAGRLERDLLAMVALSTRRGGPRKSTRKGSGTDGDTSQSSSGMKNLARVQEGQAVDALVRRDSTLAIGKKIKTQHRLPSGRRPDGIDWESKTILEFKVRGYKDMRRAVRQVERYIDELNEKFGGNFVGIIMQPRTNAFEGLTAQDINKMSPDELARRFSDLFEVVATVDRKNKK